LNPVGILLRKFFASFASFARDLIIFLIYFRPHVMKQILLRITGVRPEMRGGKAAQARPAGAAAREIKPLQRAFNPDIHGKRGIKSVGEEQNAVGNLKDGTRDKLVLMELPFSVRAIALNIRAWKRR
jgi:hypothetical protein